MKSLLVGTLAFYFLSVALAQDAVCSVKESTDLDVVIRDGDTFKYKTSPKRKYGDNIECLVTYELDASCAEMELRCKKINIKNKDVEDCTDGDKLVITNDDEETETVCGKKKKFVFKSSSNMVVEFTSDGKKRGAGAKGCVVTCTKAASAATATAAPTTAAPTTAAPTTAAPTTAAPTTAAPTTAPGSESPVANTESPLERLNINPGTIAISGFSSGAAFSTQFHVAFSEKISAVGVFAGIVYLKGMGVALGDLGDLLWDEIDKLVEEGRIDPIENISNDKVYIYHGLADSIVDAYDGEQVKTFYDHYLADGNNLEMKTIEEGEHGFPSNEQGGACEQLNSPNYVSNCHYDGAANVLAKALGSIEPKDEEEIDYILQDFDQMEFFEENDSFFETSMDKNGYVFVPDNCVNGSVQCHLHIHLHGCSQTREWIGDGYVQETGFIPLAAKNNIVMLFPQITSSGFNAAGCWNIWDYLSAWDREPYQYATKEGKQMKIIAKMVEKAAQISMF